MQQASEKLLGANCLIIFIGWSAVLLCMQSFHAESLWINENCFGKVICLKCTAHTCTCYPYLPSVTNYFVFMIHNISLSLVVSISVIYWYMCAHCVQFIFLMCKTLWLYLAASECSASSIWRAGEALSQKSVGGREN